MSQRSLRKFSNLDLWSRVVILIETIQGNMWQAFGLSGKYTDRWHRGECHQAKFPKCQRRPTEEDQGSGRGCAVR
ncbi:uncharacterized protein BYT42DRAFT_366609 [Radiomyces spectabilis]|uniref:uncharacterized protein n=1 Tax=Radiomyces spectabilis TaxID=64574 RepID=UPI0022209745|nr:uncharacterized protein BYT42DRAFT_366609 [Radiomyces spectabilis]KAI8378073.1 hypothetical protein BYT42DRAFT_366609 [Radiomyces spectabilis]